MKVQLIVVRGKPEGKAIPLTVPKFKIGRGEGCHLRPNSDQVSREHAEFIVEGGVVAVRDLKSRNGTQVNGKDITGAVRLKDRDLVQVGPLTFAVSILGAPAPAQPAPASPGQPTATAPSQPAQPAAQGRSAPEEVLNEDIDSWLVGAPSESSTEIPTSVYGGETVTIATYQGGKAETPPPTASAEEEDDEEDEEDEEEEDEELEEEEEEEEEEELAEEEDEDEEEAEDEPPLDELIDESNPFYAAKKAQKQAEKTEAKGAGAANQQFQDTSGAAGEILRKLMERRRASR